MAGTDLRKALQPLSRRLRRLMRSFARNQDGNLLVFTGLAIVPMMISIGAGIDYSRALSVQAQLQAAADSTILTLAQTGDTMTPAQLQAQALTLIGATFYNPSTTGMSVSVSQSGTTAKTYQLRASTTFLPAIMPVAGISSFPISASVTAKAKSSARNRVALVLDNSGSMNDYGKIGALQGAAASFLTSLQQATTTSEDAYVSIVPFVDVVNVGTSNAGASWIDWTEWNSGSFFASGHRTNSGNHALWSGCIADRGNIGGPSSSAYDTNVTAPTPGNAATLFPATVPNACPQSIMPLSNDWTALTNKVNSMVANGYTNQAIGLAHGWMSLVGGGPYPSPPAMDPNYQYQQTIIILSDGLNTYDRWYNWASQIDARQNLTCNNIKAAGITIYSIQVNTNGDPTSAILQSCASDASKFFEIASATDMPTIFSRIAGQLNQLTLTN